MDLINSATIAQVLHNPEKEIEIMSMYWTHLDEIQREHHEKFFTIFYKIPLCQWKNTIMSLKVLKKTPWYGLMLQE